MLTPVVSVDASVFGLLLELVKLIPLRWHFPWFSIFFSLKSFYLAENVFVLFLLS